jgi:hypothetical protein
MKEIMGKRRLSGEGLETKDVPGVNNGGGKWPQRYLVTVFIVGFVLTLFALC